MVYMRGFKAGVDSRHWAIKLGVAEPSIKVRIRAEMVKTIYFAREYALCFIEWYAICFTSCFLGLGELMNFGSINFGPE